MAALAQPNILKIQHPVYAPPSIKKKLLYKLPMIGPPVFDLKRATWGRDAEGIRRACGQIFENFLSLNSIGFWAANTLSLPAIFSTKIAADYFYGAWALVSMASSGMLVYRALTFRSDILSRLEDPTQGENERILHALEFIRGKSIPEVEIQPEDALHGPIYREWQAGRKFNRLAEGAFQHVKRRTDQKTAEKIINEIDLHVGNMQDPNPEKVTAAKEFIAEILNQNKKTIWTAVLYTFATLLSFIALMIATFTPLTMVAMGFTATYWAINIGLIAYPRLVNN